jgi:hypothetical protein
MLFNRKEIRMEKGNFEKWAIAIGTFFASAFVVMLLWNWLIVLLFGLQKLDYFMAVGILGLFNLLFKSKTK